MIENFENRKKIYIAAPYTSAPVDNTRRVMEVADKVLEMGYLPYLPHLSLLWDLHSPKSYSFWLNYHIEWLKDCDALLRLDGESVGANKEIRVAEKFGLPLFYSLEELSLWNTKKI